MLAESVSADCPVSQVVRQRVPHQRASHGESPQGKCTPPLVPHVQQYSEHKALTASGKNHAMTSKFLDTPLDIIEGMDASLCQPMDEC